MSATAATPSRSHTVQLPQALDARAAETLAGILEDSRGENLVLDASYVRMLGAHCAQLLRGAAQLWEADRRVFAVVNGCPAISDRAPTALEAFGLT